MFFANLRIRTRLWASFGIMMLIMAVIVVIGVMQMRIMDAAFADVQVTARNEKLATGVGEGINNMRGLQLSSLVSLGPARAKELERAGAHGKTTAKLAEELERSVRYADTKKVASEIRALVEAYARGHDQVMRFAEMDQVGDMNALIQGEQRKAHQAAVAAVEKFREVQDSHRAAAGKRAEEAQTHGEVVMYFLLGGALAVAVAMAHLITRGIGRSITYAMTTVDQVAKGDLAVRIDASSKDEIGQLLAALKSMQQSLSQTVSTIKAAADSVGSAAQEIAQGHADLSSRTEQQASSLEETAASMEEMSATVSQNAENARKASKRASEASAVAERGGQAVGNVVSTMSGISESSKKIADIIGVIDGIAFQTNILALNAAVEAARAGEQGRGFAVVASEVRSLAQRSAAAAKEIRQLISDSVGRIDAGSRQVAEAGKTMDEIVGTVRLVNKRISEISAASQEQSQSLTQVSDTVQQLEKVTQQNAAMVEQATAASASLEEQAGTLTRAVGSFKLAEGGKRAAVAAPAAAPPPAPAARPKPAVAKPPVAELPHKRPAAKAKEEGWEEF